jgi:hypothetical protein
MAAKGSMLKGALAKSPKGDGRVTSLPVGKPPTRQKGDAADMAAGVAQGRAGLQRLSPGVYRNPKGQLTNSAGKVMPRPQQQPQQPGMTNAVPPQGGPATRPPAPLGTPPMQDNVQQSLQDLLAQQRPQGPAPLGQMQNNPNMQQYTPNLSPEQFRQMFPQYRQPAMEMTGVYDGKQPLDMNAIMAKYQQQPGFDMSQQYDPNKVAMTQAAQAGQIPMMTNGQQFQPQQPMQQNNSIPQLLNQNRFR